MSSTCDQVVLSALTDRKGRRTWALVAAELGISRPYLSDIIHGHRQPGERILRQLGLRRVVVQDTPAYEPLTEELATNDQTN